MKNWITGMIWKWRARRAVRPIMAQWDRDLRYHKRLCEEIAREHTISQRELKRLIASTGSSER